jgi:hypothetical protein
MSRHVPRNAIVFFVGCAVWLAAATISQAGTPQPIAECGVDLPGGDYYLAGDLDCTGFDGIAINFRGRARLQFSGHAIRNAAEAIQCWRTCNLIGPGTIENNGGGARAARLFLSDMLVQNNGSTGLEAANNSYRGTVIATRTVVQGNGIGILAQRTVRLIDSEVSGNDEAGLLVLGEYQTVLHDGPTCQHGTAALENSTVAGNLVAPPAECSGFGHYPECADIKTCVAPTVDETSSCGSSVGALTGTPWGVCAND